MKPEMLQIQQYLSVHPITQKDARLRRKYISLLSYFVKNQGRGDLWSKQCLALYKSHIMDTDEDVNCDTAKDLSWFEQFKFFKYRYFLLTDCLFIRAFNDAKRGKQITEDVIKFYGERYRKKLELINEAFYTFGDDHFIQMFAELKDVYAIVWGNRNFQAKPVKKIMITANMSAGKSTLLNALAGKKITKMQNDTCTAKLHYLYNKAGEDGFNYELDHDLELNASLDILMTDNDENDSTDIVVGTRFRSIEELESSVCFIDTPGVNSSMDKDHREMSNNAIENTECDLLLYLFNGENIGSDDDIRHLKFVKEHYNGNIIFLVNRLDHYKKDVDSVKGTLDAVVADLKKIGFADPVVYPLSAYAGYLGKMKLYGEELSEDELDDIEFVKRKLQRKDFTYEEYYPVTINVNCKDKELGELLLHSGILSLEKIIYQ